VILATSEDHLPTALPPQTQGVLDVMEQGTSGAPLTRTGNRPVLLQSAIPLQGSREPLPKFCDLIDRLQWLRNPVPGAKIFDGSSAIRQSIIIHDHISSQG